MDPVDTAIDLTLRFDLASEPTRIGGQISGYRNEELRTLTEVCVLGKCLQTKLQTIWDLPQNASHLYALVWFRQHAEKDRNAPPHVTSESKHAGHRTHVHVQAAKRQIYDDCRV